MFLAEFVQVHKLRQITGFHHGARVTNPVDHMSAASQALSECSKTAQQCQTGKHRHTQHPHVSRHWAFYFIACSSVDYSKVIECR